MSSPTVCCIMLTNGRYEMAARAVRSFQSQTYENKRLVIFGSGYGCWHYPDFHPQGHAPMNEDDAIDWGSVGNSYTIGKLRNMAIKMDITGGGGPTPDKPAEIFAHFDDDDWSHPNRLTEQVALLQASGADAVGYNEALFWDSTKTDHVQAIAGALDLEGCEERGEAWLYTSPKLDVALGATLLYWRRTWEQKRFADVRHGEDTLFQTGMKVAAVSAVPGIQSHVRCEADGEPRFIAHIHGDNTSSVITPSVRDWKRAPEWDAEARRVMTL